MVITDNKKEEIFKDKTYETTIGVFKVISEDKKVVEVELDINGFKTDIGLVRKKDFVNLLKKYKL